MRLAELGYISNILSLSRVVLIIPLYYFLKSETISGTYLAFAVILLMAATDFFDGQLARKLNQKSDLGRILDPVADKLAVAVGGLLLVQYRDLPAWYLILLISRDLAILIFGLFLVYKTKVVVESNWSGKVAVTGVAIVLVCFTLGMDLLKKPFLWISVLLVAISSFDYLWKFIKLNRRRTIK